MVTSPPSVLFLHPSNEMYGSDRSLRSLIRAVADIARPIVVLPADLPYRGQLSDSLRSEGIEVLVGPLPVIRRQYLTARALIPWALRSIYGTAWLVRLARRRRAIGIVSNTTGVFAGPLVSRYLHMPHLWYVREIVNTPTWYRRLIASLALCADGSVIAVSDAVADWLGPLRGRGPRVIRNAVDTVGPPRPLPARPRAVFVGRLGTWKGHETFIEAARLAHDQVPAAAFALVGGPIPGDETTLNEVQAKVRSLDPDGTWLELMGELSDGRAAMRDAWVVAVPSTRPDPLPNVVLEAMAEGRAVIGSAIGGIPEMIADGETGELVSPGDPAGLAAALVRALQDRATAESMGAAGRKQAEARFSRQLLQSAWRALFTETFLETEARVTR